MSELHIDCPHCGSSFDVVVDGETSSMMVFSCAKCQTPLMHFRGVTSELDKEEFANLRKRLSKVLDVVMKQDSSVSDVANSLKKMVDISNEIALERVNSKSVPISDEELAQLQKDLNELDADSFLGKL